MKRVLLIDDGSLVDFIIKYTDWQIALYVCTQSGKKQVYQNNVRIDKYVELEDIVEKSKIYEFSVRDIEEYSEAFVSFDYGMQRYRKCMHRIHYEYYACIAFWEHVFQNIKIDLCLVETIDHGTQKDCLLKLAAKKYSIPLFQLTTCHFNVKNILFQYNKTERLLPIVNHNNNLPSNSFFEIAHYASQEQPLSIKQRIRSFLGNAIIRGIHIVKNGEDEVYFPGSMYRFKILDYFYSYLYMNIVRKYTQKRYVKYDPQSKYVIFFMHFEPEAVVSHYSNEMTSQIIMIQMLSEALPEGWILYVKEHPDMYKLNYEASLEYCIPSQSSFFNKYFVDKILSFDNVKIIDVKLSSEYIINNAQATATICGTVVLDTIEKGKPCIVFGNKSRTYLSKCKDIFNVSSIADIKEAYKKISSGFKPNYNDFEKIFNTYGFIISDKEEYDGYEVAVQTIKKYIEGDN